MCFVLVSRLVRQNDPEAKQHRAIAEKFVHRGHLCSLGNDAVQI